MAPPKHPVWQHFRTDKSGSKYHTDKSHKAVWCTACLENAVRAIMNLEEATHDLHSNTVRRSRETIEEAIFDAGDADAMVTGFPISGKPDYMLRHLRVCPCITEDVKAWATVQTTSTEHLKENIQPPVFSPPKTAPSTPTRSPSKRVKISGSHEEVLLGGSPSWSRQLFSQAEFEADLCELFVGNNWAFNSADSQRTKAFFKRWVPHSQPVSGRMLSGPVLDRRVAAAVDRIMPKVQRRMGTGQCDGWKDVSKTNVVSSLMTVKTEPYLVATHDVSALPKTADTLLKLVLEDLEHCETVLKVVMVAWCSDAGGDSASMRRKQKEKRPDLVVLDCWAHQVTLRRLDNIAGGIMVEIPW